MLLRDAVDAVTDADAMLCGLSMLCCAKSNASVLLFYACYSSMMLYMLLTMLIASRYNAVLCVWYSPVLCCALMLCHALFTGNDDAVAAITMLCTAATSCYAEPSQSTGVMLMLCCCDAV
jgi:hypothetical protein